ncbi:hypothetical protein M3936_16540 [Sutcliffiella horikoshii]|uniref:hypothetical protein n=1 Tax=Sutcliffiella horikoshii TaxID=79883 RepID=UPI0020406E8D|nr:hypothetical protein [Sutcliffiella horikoshii]MCM3619199.1 hypothetical protein [Sutcliffiella horikoshii]
MNLHEKVEDMLYQADSQLAKQWNNPKKKAYYSGQVDVLLHLTDALNGRYKPQNTSLEDEKRKKEDLQFISQTFALASRSIPSRKKVRR